MILLVFIYVLLSGLIGIILGLTGVLNGDSVYTPIDLINRIKKMNRIKIYHILFIFGILILIIYYISFAVAILFKKIGNITICKKN